MATIQVRVSDEDKAAVEKILASLGLDMTTAVRTFFKRIRIDRGLPYEVKQPLTVNGFTPEFEAEVLEAAKEAAEGKNVDGPYESAEELVASLQSE